MKPSIIFTTTALVLLLGGRAMAFEVDSSCIYAPDPESAFISVLKGALKESLLPTDTQSIVKTVNDRHSPEYDVTLKNGKLLHIECDDDGDMGQDGSCQCNITKGL